MADLRVLKRGARNNAVRQLQSATNRRLDARGLDRLQVREDSVLGASTLRAVRTAAWALGAHRSTLDSISHGMVSIGAQRMIRNPGKRTERQLEVSRIRMANLRRQRKLRAEARRRATSSSRARAVNAFLAKVGTRESPPGSNGGGMITVMQAFWGFGRAPWCGISAGYHAVKFGGVRGMRSDVASVSAIESHARRARSPYGHWQSSVQGALQGSFLVIGGSGVHVGMLVEAHSDGSATTVEGNTSFGASGSQSSGGCIARRRRSDAEITGVATMNYPG